jgi:hypothetical protein
LAGHLKPPKQYNVRRHFVSISGQIHKIFSLVRFPNRGFPRDDE